MEEAWELAAVSGDEFEISASDKGVSAKVKGGAASRLGHALADVVSPASKLLGLVGDQFEYLRIYQAHSFSTVMKRVEEKAAQRNITAKPVPLKLGVQWAEGASLEDVDNEDNLSELWAELLLSSAENSISGSLFFVRVLKEITKKEAKLLKRFVFGGKGKYAGDPLEHVKESDLNWQVLSSQLKNFNTSVGEANFEVVIDSVISSNERPGLLVEHLLISKSDVEGEMSFWESQKNVNSLVEYEQSLALLVSLGLLNKFYTDGQMKVPEYGYSVTAYCLTPIAAEFIKACGIQND